MNIEFCSECNNILYPKEDNTEAQLTLICKTCDHIQEASTNRIASFHYKTRPTGFKTYAKELAKDPTLPKTNQICSNCGNNVVVYFQNRDNEEEIAFDLVYICVSCYHYWS
ncbi:DNA-directed RNA polymerase II subunit RPB9 [Nosema bombycis CQ1]|uniref:DNA-directed RNA polymerase II subunit RPB9 n=1 Tax=Nosema bombycis (strain CQ1 / CVCC 102059) TaxID=578461 RepID=R0KQF5_NOSB1|nr:DNA-directed RNA polymerase II subunit RPB9 [Nosema bombycis CQ1]|eukprot:EOB12951.1 DNA-directed RNA polymerase II subunit RPB9 [Nosema bombycis CQ1]